METIGNPKTWTVEPTKPSILIEPEQGPLQKTAFVLEAGPWLPRCEGLGVPVGCGNFGIRSRKDPNDSGS